MVLEFASVARKLSLEPGFVWRPRVTPNRVDRAILRGIDRIPGVTREIPAGSLRHFGLLHGVNIGLLLSVASFLGTRLDEPVVLAVSVTVFVMMVLLPYLEVPEYAQVEVVRDPPASIAVHDFSAFYAFVVVLALADALANGVSPGVVVFIGALFSVPFVITQVVVVFLFGYEMTRGVDEERRPRFRRP